MNLEQTLRHAWPDISDFIKVIEGRPSVRQYHLFNQVEKRDGKRVVDCESGPEVERGLAVWLVWKVLSRPGSTGIIVGEDDARVEMMAQVAGTFSRLPALAQHVRLEHVYRIGTDPGWKIFATPHECAPMESTQAICFGVLMEADKMAEEDVFRANHPNLRRLVRVW